MFDFEFFIGRVLRFQSLLFAGFTLIMIPESRGFGDFLIRSWATFFWFWIWWSQASKFKTIFVVLYQYEGLSVAVTCSTKKQLDREKKENALKGLKFIKCIRTEVPRQTQPTD